MVAIIKEQPGIGFLGLLDECGAAPLARYPKFVDKLKATFDTGRSFPEGTTPQVILLIGESGTGKSWYARKHYPNAYRWALGNGGNSIWMDNYDGQTECVIDDYAGQIPFRTLLNLIDFHPYSMQCKGGTNQVHVRTWIITSNLDPNDWYPNEKIAQQLEPLERRLKEWGSSPNFTEEFKQWRKSMRTAPLEAASASAGPALSLEIPSNGIAWKPQVGFNPPTGGALPGKIQCLYDDNINYEE